MDQVIIKLKEHDKRFNQHDKRFDQIDRRFDEHDKILAAHTKRFDSLDTQVDFLATKVLEHDDRLERIEQNMATKTDIRKIMGVLDILDTLVVYAKKNDQEVTILAHQMREVRNDIAMIKPLVGLA